MTKTIIYHNPACGTSRNVLGLLREAGIEPVVVEYLKTPLTHDEIVVLLGKMGVSARELLRRKGTPYEELGLDDLKWSEDELISFMVTHPILMNRPVVVMPHVAKLCRPSETVLEIIPGRMAV